MAAVVTNLGVVANREGDYARARELLEEAIAICRKLGHMEGITIILTNLAYNAIAMGEFSRAWQWCSEGLAYARKSGYKMEVAYTLLNLGLTANQLGKCEEARASFSESLTLLCELGDKVGIPYALTGLATMMGAQGRAVQAAQLQGAVAARLTESGTQLERVENADYDKTAATLRAVLGEAAYRKAFEAGQALPPDQAIELALSSRG